MAVHPATFTPHLINCKGRKGPELQMSSRGPALPPGPIPAAAIPFTTATLLSNRPKSHLDRNTVSPLASSRICQIILPSLEATFSIFSTRFLYIYSIRGLLLCSFPLLLSSQQPQITMVSNTPEARSNPTKWETWGDLPNFHKQAQTLEQRRRNAKFAKTQESRMGKSEDQLQKKTKAPQKSPISMFWMGKLAAPPTSSLAPVGSMTRLAMHAVFCVLSWEILELTRIVLGSYSRLHHLRRTHLRAPNAILLLNTTNSNDKPRTGRICGRCYISKRSKRCTWHGKSVATPRENARTSRHVISGGKRPVERGRCYQSTVLGPEVHGLQHATFGRNI